jgi:hypothetical protein
MNRNVIFFEKMGLRAKKMIKMKVCTRKNRWFLQKNIENLKSTP